MNDNYHSTQSERRRDLFNIDEGGRQANSIFYDSSDHWRVLTQSFGSIWPQVLPFCLANAFSMIVLEGLNIYASSIPEDDWSDKLMAWVRGIGITKEGHTLLGGILAFLLISRVNMALARFNGARANLGKMYKGTRDIVQHMYSWTREEQDDATKEWRSLVSYRALLLLRTTMATVDYPSTLIPAWEISELNGDERKDVLKYMFHGNDSLQKKYAHPGHKLYEDTNQNQFLTKRDKNLLMYRSEKEATLRVPLRVAYIVQKAIFSKPDVGLSAFEKACLLRKVDLFMEGFYGIRIFMTTPIPFPLIQMAHTFVLAFTFTIPFVFIDDESGPFAHIGMLFFLTYGFVGLELLAIEMDDPFGDDDNDLDNMSLARSCMEDVYLTVSDADGFDWAMKLRRRMEDEEN